MARHLPPNTMAHMPAPRVVHHPDPAARPGQMHRHSSAYMAAKRREYELSYARWAERQLRIAEHDRKVRRFLLGAGAVVGTAFLAVVAVVGWIVWHAITAAGTALVVVPLVLLALGGLVAGGRRCITIVQHWH